MNNSKNAYGDINHRLPPSFRTLASHSDLEKLRELARSDEFSDSESDGVDSDDDEDDVVATMIMLYCFSSPKRKIVAAQHRVQLKQQKTSDDKASSSPKGDEWELVDKSPTFESIVEGKKELGGESWFVQEQEQSTREIP
ncbi:unnamed protein product [Peronospora farinosa]|uniref:Uncharacterized protein n=1 Tax=Peronospora farinosa TaxID=134698 RepID=A0AAV0UCN3_9STRA|nr:unnamed protein product [Peronospora farinosa]CAI5733488.1 unnamed protein product [Peronospora farinosa]